jgi:uncharacterized metal-binding protein (TIGR02443 family)
VKRARFIAGARCRACGEVDRIVVEEAPDGRTQRCVVCGHRESIHDNERDDDPLEQAATIIRISKGDRSDTKTR